jgi:hypothetical protein
MEDISWHRLPKSILIHSLKMTSSSFGTISGKDSGAVLGVIQRRRLKKTNLMTPIIIVILSKDLRAVLTAKVSISSDMGTTRMEFKDFSVNRAVKHFFLPLVT